MSCGHSTAKDSWSECTGHNAKYSLCQINGVQLQQKGWKITDEQLSEGAMVTTKGPASLAPTLTRHLRPHLLKVQEQPFRVYLFRGHGGGLGTWAGLGGITEGRFLA